MFEFLTSISIDNSPLEPGYQPSVYYVILSLIIPIVVGLVTAMVFRLLGKTEEEA